jgi:hypothetical protein
MLFGKHGTFAIEAIIEPGPEFSPFLGNNITGRFRLFFGGLEVGKFDEPCCVIRQLSDHLVDKCESASTLWHESLADRSPDVWFKLLNDSLYLIGAPEPADEYYRMDFLTNVSEALNNVKGFLVAPPGEPLHTLIQLSNSETVHHHIIPIGEFCSVSAKFAAWVKEREDELLPS